MPASSLENSSFVSPANPTQTPGGLCWQVYLLRRDLKKLPTVLLILFIGTACAWLMFGTLLPAMAALLLLCGSAGEYLFPIRYTITDDEIRVHTMTSRLALKWKDIRRCRIGTDNVLVTPLPQDSRLDAFRGVVLRFAPEGMPGDRQSVLMAIRQHAPHLFEEASQAPNQFTPSAETPV